MSMHGFIDLWNAYIRCLLDSHLLLLGVVPSSGVQFSIFLFHIALSVSNVQCLFCMNLSTGVHAFISVYFLLLVPDTHLSVYPSVLLLTCPSHFSLFSAIFFMPKVFARVHFALTTRPNHLSFPLLGLTISSSV